MNVLGQHLEERENAGAGAAQRLDRKKAADVWMFTGSAPEDRLLAFDCWARAELAARIDWTWAGAHKDKRIEQCRVVLEKMVLALWKRGWMLSGPQLAKRIEELLDAVGKYQRQGKVADFWPYFKAAVHRYVGLNAEEIQAEATKASAIFAPWVKAFGGGRGAGEVFTSMPELVAQRADEITKVKEPKLREKLARARARSKVTDEQGTLL